MNKEWSDINKKMQKYIEKKDTFSLGIETLLDLRSKLLDSITELCSHLSIDDYNAIPFINAKGFENKTIAYSLFHIFRIEDIVSNILINKSQDIFFKNNFQKKMNASIITTGNELKKEEIKKFSEKLEIDMLWKYINEVYENSNNIIKSLYINDLKIRMTEKDKDVLNNLQVVADSESWLIDYWCSKDISGLLRMPFSRHWIMHIEACFRISEKLCGRVRKNNN